MREKEEKDLLEFLYFLDITEYGFYENFFYNYSIPQISKEFDLLRISKNIVVNIEIKHFSSEEKIQKQLERNNYYLSFLEGNKYLFCYEVQSKRLFLYDDKQDIKEVSKKILIDILNKQTDIFDGDIDTLFKPSNYLVSPFNKTDEFIKNKYFLTNHQEQIRKSIVSDIVNTKEYEFISLIGTAGSGKTLLAYDIAKKLMKEGYKITIIHCGTLNEGHKVLQSKYHWDIYPIKSYSSIDYKKTDVIIIDEGQRIDDKQLIKIIDQLRNYKINCIFSNDPDQVLSYHELKSSSLEIVNKILTKKYELSKKIRTNIEISSFISNLFNLRNGHPNIKYKKIFINHFMTRKDALKYIRYLTSLGWDFINYTPSNYYSEDFECLNEVQTGVSHSVIGQEFDNVIVVIDSKFFYEDNQLKSQGWKSDKNGEKMLYQSLTRAREKLYIIIIDNKNILKECFKILNK